MIKTKIIATLGPACSNVDCIKQMLDNEVDVFRLNFSHGKLTEHKKFLDSVNKAVSAQHRMIAVMGDICGPKIRTKNINSAGIKLYDGDMVTIVRENASADTPFFNANYEALFDDAQVGHRIYIDDGQIQLHIVKKDKDIITCTAIAGGTIHNQKGINLPDTVLSIPSITDTDWKSIDWAIENNLDFLAMSFVRSADDIKQLRDYLEKAGSDIKIVAKIETPQALEHIDDIINTSDAILIARGDLGVEMELAEVPLIQKKITGLCRHYGKPVIVATQMLQSMIDSPTPTRAEVSDVANAIMDFTDAVMLSGETAVGKYPINSLKSICRIASVTETFLDENEHIHPKAATDDFLAVTAALARSVAQIVDDTAAKLVAVWSQTGSSARLISKARIDTPIIAFSSNKKLCRQMSLHYGVIPFYKTTPQNIDAFVKLVEKFVLEQNLAKSGDNIIIVAGEPVVTEGTKNAILAHNITDS